MIPLLALAPWSSPPPPAPLVAQADRSSPDRSRRFPLRREGGGTRGACASRLVAHLVPLDGRLDPGSRPILGVIEGESPEMSPKVMRCGSMLRRPLRAATASMAKARRSKTTWP